MQCQLVRSLAAPGTGAKASGKGMLTVWGRTPTRERISMAEQIPEAWIGKEVIVYFEAGQRQAGTLEDVSEKGIVVRSRRGDAENVFWYPLTSVTRLLQGSPQGADISSF